MADRVKTCPDCNGDGVLDKDTEDERQCPTCGGLGFVRDDDDDYEEVIKTSRERFFQPHVVFTARKLEGSPFSRNASPLEPA